MNNCSHELTNKGKHLEFSKMFFIIVIFCVLLLLTILMVNVTAKEKEPEDIPQAVKELIFHKATPSGIKYAFDNPVIVEVPADGSSRIDQLPLYEEARKEKCSSWVSSPPRPPLFGRWYKRLHWNIPLGGFPGSKEKLEDFQNLLIKQDLVKLNTVSYSDTCDDLKEVEKKVPVYADKIEPLVISRESRTVRAYDEDFTKEALTIAIGKRVLESIDYVNQYEAGLTSITGMDVKTTFWAITFTYKVEPNIAGLPKMQFQGNAKVYRDPDDGKWKTAHLYLPYDGEGQGDYEARKFRMGTEFDILTISETSVTVNNGDEANYVIMSNCQTPSLFFFELSILVRIPKLPWFVTIALYLVQLRNSYGKLLTST